MTPIARLSALCIALSLAFGTPAMAAATDLVYAPATSSSHDFNHAPLGQTFIATASRVKAGLYIADQTSFTNWLATVYPTQILPGSYPYAVAPKVVVNVKLIAGHGTTGAVLHSQDVVLNAPFMGYVDVDYAAAGITLTVGSAYTLLMTDISGQAYPNGVTGWAVPAVHATGTGAALPPGAYAAGYPVLQGALVTNDAGIGDNAFHVLDQGSAPVQPTCSGANAVITSVGRNFLVVNGGLNLADHVWYAPQAATTFTGGTTTFTTGELINFTGTLDPVAGCYATSMTVMPAVAPMVISGTLPAAQVGSAYSASLGASGGVAPYSWMAGGAPAGLSFSNGVLSGVPTAAGTYPLSVVLSDARGASVSASYSLTVNPAPNLSCSVAKTAEGKGAITAVGAGYVVVGGRRLTLAPCTTLKYSGYTKAFSVGQQVEWKAYLLNGQLIALRVAGF